MSKLIKLTPEIVAEYTREFAECLKSAKFSDGKITFSKTLGSISRKATVYFTESAWIKMQSLINKFDKEIAWHGVAERGADTSKDEYIISDILVYPQTVSGTTVEMDVSKYEEWIRDNIEDERFFHIGMQGHSHVNMGVTPSSTDLKHQDDILTQLTDDMFYIFMIWNKNGAKNIRIYDLAKNVAFDTNDVDVQIIAGDYGLDAFMTEAKNMVAEKKSTPTYYSSTSYGGYKYEYGSHGYSPCAGVTTSQNKDTNKKDTAETKSKLKKGKRKQKDEANGGTKGKKSYQMSIYEGYDDYDDIY